MQDQGRASLNAAEPTPDADPGTASRRRPLIALVLALALLVLVLDQATKTWALATLTPGEPVDLIGSWIRLDLIRNPGAAFSLGDSATWVLTIISIAILVGVAVAIGRVGSTAWAITLGLLLGGALGNIVDRLLREPGFGRGHVVDFIDYFGWFIGNVADIFIVGAAGLVMILAYRQVPLGGSRAAAPETDPDE